MPEKRDTSVEAVQKRCLDPERGKAVKALPLVSVEILDDDHMDYARLAEAMCKLLAVSRIVAEGVVGVLEREGRVRVMTCHREKAELVSRLFEDAIGNFPGMPVELPDVLVVLIKA